jgi:hypothetical protein
VTRLSDDQLATNIMALWKETEIPTLPARRAALIAITAVRDHDEANPSDPEGEADQSNQNYGDGFGRHGDGSMKSIQRDLAKGTPVMQHFHHHDAPCNDQCVLWKP